MKTYLFFVAGAALAVCTTVLSAPAVHAADALAGAARDARACCCPHS